MAEILPTSSLWFQLEYLRGVEQSQRSGTSSLLGALCLLQRLGCGCAASLALPLPAGLRQMELRAWDDSNVACQVGK